MGNISSLAHQLADKHLMGEKAAEGFIKSFFSVLMDGLHQDKAVKVRGLGTFKVTRVAPRESVDVNTGERIVIEGRGQDYVHARRHAARLGEPPVCAV